MARIKQFAIVVGAMKCGTTSLYRYLADHPQLAPCRVKSPNFFSDDKIWEKGLDWYEDQFEFDSEHHRMALEGSTAYTKMPYVPDCAARMAATGRRFKIMYLIRDPIRRIESHYTMGEAQRWQRAPSEDAPIVEKLIDLSRYAWQIGHYYDQFDADDIRIIRLEDLSRDPRATLNSLCEFLEVDDFVFPGADTTHNPSRSMVGWPGWFTTLKRSKTARALTGVIPARRKIVERVFGLKVVEHVQLTSAQKRQIWAALEKDTRELRERYGVDTSGWQNPEG